jgi:hypothetical protein
MKKLQAELKGKAQVERENRDIYLEQIKLKAQEQRQTILEGLKCVKYINTFLLPAVVVFNFTHCIFSIELLEIY